MKLKIINDIEFIVYIKNDYLKLDDDIETFIEKVFDTLSEIYDIRNNGYYTITMLTDPNYGIILECLTTKEEYYSYKLNIDLEVKDTVVKVKTGEGLIIPSKITDYEMGEIIYV